MDSANPEFTSRVLTWAKKHGRKDLPWQQEISPYRVWVSEIMLQQTRVETVIPYFERFMRRFPTVTDLADASLDAVLAHWSGLGYYARARNMHKAAGLIASRTAFPDELSGLCALPGIGRSTAGAILSVAFEKPAAILDGNVKRVLTRFYGIEGWPEDSKIKRELWRLSETHTPVRGCREYTQAIMDLGATVCTRHKPMCGDCPLQSQCSASLQGRTNDLPVPRRRKALPVRSCVLLLLRDETGHCYLVKRPPSGVWGGLWALPEFSSKVTAMEWCAAHSVSKLHWWPSERHTFSHFHLDYTPVVGEWADSCNGVRDEPAGLWCDPDDQRHFGLPAPVSRLVSRLKAEFQNLEP